jgi:hypothetical protein
MEGIVVRMPCKDLLPAIAAIAMLLIAPGPTWEPTVRADDPRCASASAQQPIVYTAYRLDGRGMPGDDTLPPEGTIPSQPGLPAGVPGAGTGPSWPTPNPATFHPPKQSPGTTGACPLTAGIDPGPMSVCEGTQILGRVGADVILMSEITPVINEALSLSKDRLPTTPAELEAAREQMTRQILQSKIEFKLVYQDARRKVPKEGWQRMEKAMNERFARVEIERLMKQLNVSGRDQLDAKLLKMGSSVERMRQSYLERTMAETWLREQVKADEDVRPEDILAYYQNHIADFETPAQVRWEELVVRFDRHANRDEAYAVMAELGNQVLSGRTLAEVAKQRSEGTTAADGGQREWTRQGSLVLQKLDQALFAPSLPVGALSQIIEDGGQLIIIRVLERREKVRTSFIEAQLTIREKMKDERKKLQMQRYIARLRQQIPVWTVYDTQVASPNTGGKLR